MKKTRKPNRILATSAAALVALCLLPTAAQSATFSYDDGGGTFNWGDNFNWSGDVAPVNGSDLVFSAHTNGAASQTATNNILSSVQSITFGGQTFLLDGNAITLGAGGLTNNSNVPQLINFGGTGVTLGAGQTWSATNSVLNVASAVNTNGQALIVTTGAGQFNTLMTGAVTGTGSITKSGPGGILFLTNAGNNYSGGTTVNGGFVSFNSSTALGTGNVTVNSGGALISSANSTLTSALINLNSGSTVSAAAGTTLIIDPSTQIRFGDGPGTVTFGSNGNTGVVTIDPTPGIAVNGNANIVVAFGTLRNGGGINLGFATSSMDSTTVNAGATLDVNDTSMNVKNLLGAGAVTLGANAATTLTLASGNFTGIIGGAGAVTTTGSNGNTTFAGLNTYLGITNVNGGTLVVSQGTSGINSALGFGNNTLANGTVVNAGGKLQLATGTNITNEFLTLNNGGQLVQAAGGTSSWGGGILVTGAPATLDAVGGTLNVGTIDKTDVNLTLTNSLNSAPGVATINVNGAITGNAVGFNDDLIVNGVTANLNAANTYLGPTTITSTVPGNGIVNANVVNALPTAFGRTTIAMDAAGAGGSQLNLFASQAIQSLTGAATSVVDLNANTLTIGTAAGTTTFAGIIEGPLGGLIKDGASTQILTGNSTYIGATTVQEGRLQIGNGTSGNLNGASAVTVNPGANLDLNLANNGNFANTIVNNGSVNGINAGGVVFQFLDGGISGIGSVNQTGTGITVLTNTNNYTGATTVSAGILRIGNGNNGTINSSSGVTATGTGTLQINQADTTVFSPTIFLNGAGTALNTITGAGKTVTVQGLVSGTGFLQNNGGGTTVLTAANSYTGETQVTNGTLQIGNGVSGSINASSNVRVFSIGDALAINMADGSTFTPGVDVIAGTEVIGLVGFAKTNTISGAITGAGGVTQTGAGTTVLTGANLYTGSTAVNAGTLQVGNGTIGSLAAGSAVTVALGSTLAVNLVGGGTFGNGVTNAGAINAIATGINTFSGITTGAGSFNQNGAGGRSILTGANAYTGATNVNAGTLQIGNGTIGSINGTSLVTVAAASTLEVNLAAAGIFGNTVTTTGNGAVISNSANTNTFSGNLIGTGTFTKNNTGKTITQGANTYTGATTVAAGTLQVDGLLTSSNVTVNSGATLGGVGSIGQTVTVLNGGNLAPGASPGTITIGTLILNSLANSNYELNTPGVIGGGINDLTNVTTNLTLDGVLNITNGGAFAPGAFRLFNYGGILTNNTLNIGTVPAGFNAPDFIVKTNINNQVNLIVLAGPGAPVTQFWDGTNNVTNPSPVVGGVGTWENFNTNWTTAAGTPNSSWQNGIAVFGTTPGLVTLADDIYFKGLQFDVSGYRITGGGNTLVPTDTGTVTVNGALASIATIDAKIVDGINPVTLAVRPASLLKNGTGTLILTNGTNTYSGGTSIDLGRLSVTLDGQLGTGNLTFNGNGELLVDGGTFSTAKTVTIGATNTGRISNSNTGSPAVFTGQFTLNATSTLAIGSTGNTGVVTLTPGVAPTVNATSLVAVDFGTLRNGNATGFQAITAAAASTTIAAGATLDANGFNSTVNNLLGAGSVTNSSATAMTYTVNKGNFTGVIDDGASTVALTKATAGLLSLGGQNTYSGVTQVNAGILQATGTETLDVLGQAISGAFSPNSDYTVQGTGILELNGNDNTIQALNGDVAGTGIVRNNNVSSAFLTVGNNDKTGSFSGLVQDGPAGGALFINKIGTGRQTFSRNNTYTGDTSLFDGELFADVSPGSGTNAAFGTGRLFIYDGTKLGSTIDQQTIPNDITVRGDFTIQANTHLNFPGDVDLDGGIRSITGNVPSAELKFTGSIANGGVNLIHSGLTYTAFIYGDNSFADVANTYTGLTTLNDGVFLVLNKNTTGAGLDGAVRGDVLVNQGGSVDYFLPNQIADTSRVTVNSTGLTIAGPTTFAGFEMRNNDDTIGSLYGNGTVGLGSAILTVGAGNFTGVIKDGEFGAGGQLTKNTTGTLVLTGNSTYTGNTNINNGVVVIDGSVQSPTVFINFAGTLMGTGIAHRNVVNSGVFSPGRSPGTFTIGGNYTQNATGTLVIEIEGKNAGQHDLVKVGGQAALSGNLRLVDVKGTRLKVGEKITFLTAGGGVTGKFSTVDNPFATTNTIVTTDVIYDPNAVSLAAVQGSFAEFAAEKGLTPNQRSVAAALDQIASNKRQAKLIGYLNEQSLNNLAHDFDLIAAEEIQSIYTIGISQANIQTANLSRRMDDIRAGTAGFSAAGLAVSGTMPQYSGSYLAPNAGLAGPEGKASKEIRPPATEPSRLGVFFTGVGEWSHVGTTYNASGYNLSSGGFTLGLDYKVNEHFAVGINAGYARSSADLYGNGNVTVDGAKIGVYATYFNEGFYVDASVQGGYNSYDTRRSALQGSANGSTNGGEFNALLATGYDWKSNGVTFGPVASVQYTNIGFDGYKENGSLAPLNYESQSGESLRTALGMKASYDWHLGGVIIRPEVRAAWQHEFGDSAFGIGASFVNGGSNFTVDGAEIGRDSLLLGAGFAVLWNERTSTYVYYDGELGRSNYSSNNVSGGVRLEF